MKSKRRKSRHSAHTHQNWTGLVCFGGRGPCAGAPEGVSWGGCLRNRLLPPATALFVQWIWRPITGSQGQKTGARGSSGCHCLCLLLPQNHRQMWPRALQIRNVGEGKCRPCLRFLAFTGGSPSFQLTYSPAAASGESGPGLRPLWMGLGASEPGARDFKSFRESGVIAGPRAEFPTTVWGGTQGESAG